jgi:hypothetical protein
MRLLILIFAAISVAAAPHAFLGTSHARKSVYLRDCDGRIVWEYTVPNPQDAWLLDNGNILTTWRHGVKEIAPSKSVVWEFNVQPPNEVPICQPLPDGNFLIGIVGECRLIEINRANQILHEIKLQTTETNPHAQFRMCRKTEAGTYLVPFTAEGAVREYDRDGNCVRHFPALRSPVCAERLNNGNTIITGSGGVTEFAPDSSVVWQIDMAVDLPDVNPGIPAGVHRLDNGNSLFCNWRKPAMNDKLDLSIIEVTPEKKIVWSVDGAELSQAAQCHIVPEDKLKPFIRATGNYERWLAAPENFLPTGKRVYQSALNLNERVWPQSTLIHYPGYERLLNGDIAHLPSTENPGFGGALAASEHKITVTGRPALDALPLTVRLRVKCGSAEHFNIFVAHEPKTSPAHWELYSYIKDGTLAFYMPGNQPAVIRSQVCVTDGRWHDVAVVLNAGKITLFSDGSVVGEAPMTRAPGQSASVPTRLGIGSLVEGGLFCDGYLDDLRIQQAAEVIEAPLAKPQSVDENTLFYASFDSESELPNGSFQVRGKMREIISLVPDKSEFLENLLPRGGIEPTVAPGEKPPKNIAVVSCNLEELCTALRRIGIESVKAHEFRPGILNFWGEHIFELRQRINGKIKLPRGAVEQVYDEDALITANDKTPLDVILRRTEVLLDYLEQFEEVDSLLLKTLRADLRRVQNIREPQSHDVFAACALRRAVLFSNPALDDYNKLVFLARATYAGSRLTNMRNSDRTGGHFATQCFGFNTIRGGGIFSLENWRGTMPVVRDLIADNRVLNGRLKGKTLDAGSFYSPEVSYDGKTLYFAHCGATEHRWVWSDETVWKLFKLDFETKEITQLTEGPWNDFDPVELPSGRLVFISERRGGFIRCFGEGARLRVPTFVLHSMSPRGGDIYPISYYETSEWHPSVDNNGMLVYTRWDYTDRENCLGSQFWISYPDGRDPRAPHGNYPQPWHTFEDNTHGDHRFGTCADAPSGLPMAQMHIRAIPDSHRYVLTAAPHHGESFGTLCVLDLRLPDDGHMGQLRRVTPYFPFPESEMAGRSQYAYATPWAVNEDFFICNRWEDLILVDRFGNEELICERELLPKGYDPRLRLTHPKPLRARPVPPAIPQQTAQGDAYTQADKRTTIGVVNVNVTDQPFPTDRRPVSLRVVQVIPKDGPWMDRPMIGYATENTPRIPLGSVPIEPDGSVYFEAPAGKQLIFQLLDENNMAIQTMRTTAFAHPGERLTCLGCHEPKQESYTVKTESPLAFHKAPAKLEPEVGGVEPAGFHRLVEPVLQTRCVSCHTAKGEGPQKMDFEALREYVFRFSGGMARTTIKKDYGGSRSIPGRCGAMASRLGCAMLTPAHQAAVPLEERSRILLWLDLNAPRYGAYHDLEAQQHGEIVWPLLDVDPADPMANAD